VNIFTIFLKKLSILITLLLLITNYCLSQPNIPPPSKNIILHEKPKDFPKITLEDKKTGSDIDVIFNKQITVINFWATWCAPCKEEMPSLDRLVDILGPEYIEIIAVNVETVDYKKSKQFLDDLKVKNFDSYFDKDLKVIKKLRLRGVPTTLLINKEGKEFARVVGSIDFADKKFISWIRNF
jgi:thiol-disulfide isomerase/thioredoxin